MAKHFLLKYCHPPTDKAPGCKQTKDSTPYSKIHRKLLGKGTLLVPESYKESKQEVKIANEDTIELTASLSIRTVQDFT